MATATVNDRTATKAAPAAAANPGAIADPAPLGLAAFAMTTFVLSIFNSHIVKAAGLDSVVLPLALFYGGTAQLLAGLWEFKRNNTFGALAFVSYGSFWLAFASYAKFVAPTLPAATAHEATGIFLLAWAIFTVYMIVAALRTNAVILAVFVLLAITFILLAFGNLGNHSGIIHAGGYFGFLTAIAAWYGSMAVVTNTTWGRPVLPVWPLAK